MMPMRGAARDIVEKMKNKNVKTLVEGAILVEQGKALNEFKRLIGQKSGNMLSNE